MKHVGMYIHIPFCAKKCDYCDFYSCDNKKELIEEYVKCLKEEITIVGEGIILDAKNQINDWVTVDTIYIGGGTPSYIDSKYIKEIVELVKQKFTLKNDVEITIEVNPGTVNREKLEEYIECGINRCSIGFQATRDELLNEIGRIHSVEQFLDTYKIARNVGFNNINIDFIIGLPNQNMEDMKEVIKITKKLNPEHISVYSLIIEEGTKLKKKIDDNTLRLPDESLEREMYWYIKKNLEAIKYKHYEISNFAKNGYESKHNMDCWKQKEYLGLGCGAHSYTDNIRFSNIDNIEEYIYNFINHKDEDNIIFHEKQDKEAKMKEYMMLGLRKMDGVSFKEFSEKFKMDCLKIFRAEINKLQNKELIEVSDKGIKLTNKGIDFANIVWQEFV